MLELPETINLARQLTDEIVGKTVALVYPPTKEHKFCWFKGTPEDYGSKIIGSSVQSACSFGIYAEILFGNGEKLCVNDGVNLRLAKEGTAPKDYQLLIEFSDGTALVFTVAMYGGIVLHDGSYDNEYYLKSKNALSPFSPNFREYYKKILLQSKPTLSMKALLATEQRFPGIGNGTVQDILFEAGLHPKRKIRTLNSEDSEKLFECTVSVLREMTEMGGRDTEKNIYGNPGGYITKMSKNTASVGCPVCGGRITKEAYLGGSVYYCAHCQPQAE